MSRPVTRFILRSVLKPGTTVEDAMHEGLFIGFWLGALVGSTYIMVFR